VPTAASEVLIPIVTRVRALHTFEPTEPGELAFEKGDVIKVVDRGYKDWWRGQLKGRTGIFPVNYVEPLPEPTASQLAKEAEQEAAVFAQAANVDKLLTMLREFDPAKDNLADNEDIQASNKEYFFASLLCQQNPITGTISKQHGPSSTDCQAHRQVQSETR
jgi:signal transducing adaptor molecule